jgi:uncharacterized protein (TIGR02611 family)
MAPWKLAKRIVIFVIGVTVVLFGIALIVLPGPAIVVIPVGLAILATEFVWAQRLLKKVKEQGARAFSFFKKQDAKAAVPPSCDEPGDGSSPTARQDPSL